MTRILLKPLGLRRGRTYLLILLAVGLIGYGVYTSLAMLTPKEEICVRLGAGSAVARRFQIAEYLAGEARTHGLHIEVVPTNGFEDTMRQVSAGTLDAALVSSGLQLFGCDNAQLLTGLDEAPLHILVRRELADSGLSLREALEGRRVNLGPAGTNDREIAGDVLKFLRLRSSGDDDRDGDADQAEENEFADLSLSKDELEELAAQVLSLRGPEREAKLRELPDAVMMVNSLPSPLIQHLIDTQAYCLMPFPYGEPYLTTDLRPGKATEGVNRSQLEAVMIPAAMYVGKSPIPATDCPTIGSRTLLMARGDLPIGVARQLMEVVFETEFAGRIKPLGPREIASSHAIHPGATAYLDRNDPLLTSQFFEKISGALSIFGAFSAGALSLYGYLRRRRIRRPDEYIDQIRMVEARLSEHDAVDPAAKPEALVRELDERLMKLKEELIHDYCNKRVDGEVVVLSILSMVADSRAELRRSTRRTEGGPANAGLASVELGGLRAA